MFGIFLEAINDGLRRTFTIKGRSSRLQYNSFILFIFLVDLFINLINPDARSLNLAVVLALYAPMITCQIRRSHDVGKSGWWILIPFYGLYLVFKKSVEGNSENNPAL